MHHGQLLATIAVFRGLIHAAEPPYTKPHDYMNLDRPLRPLKYAFELGKIASRTDALRHSLYLLEQAERDLTSTDTRPTFYQEKAERDALVSLGAVGATLMLHGIDSSLAGVQEAA